jgi:hypothetical protein
MTCNKLFLVVVVGLVSGCTHQPGVFRLTAPANATTLIPPDVKDTAIARAEIRIGPIPRKTVCDPSTHGLLIQRKGTKGRVIVTREALNATSGPELFSWTVALEKQGCVQSNEAFRLAESIIDALPLDLAKRSQLIQGRSDLKSVNSLRVVAPVLKPGTTYAPPEAIQSTTQGSTPGSINVELKMSPSVIGYEIDWYDFPAQDSGPGYRLIPRRAEIHVGDNVEHPAAPSIGRFEFGPNARWYELYMMTKVSSNDFDFVVFSARTSNELQNRVAEFQKDATKFLQTADPTSYTVLPHGSGINAYMRVKLNGVSIDLPKGNTVRQALAQAAPAHDPRLVLPLLRVRKLHDGKLFPVEWDKASDQILSLPLEGGEEINW